MRSRGGVRNLGPEPPMVDIINPIYTHEKCLTVASYMYQEIEHEGNFV